MVIYGYISLLKAMTLLCYYQEDVGLLVGLYQVNCMKIYCYVELYIGLEPWHG